MSTTVFLFPLRNIIKEKFKKKINDSSCLIKEVSYNMGSVLFNATIYYKSNISFVQ